MSPIPWEKLSRYICNAIDPNISLEENKEVYVITGGFAEVPEEYEVKGAINKFFYDAPQVYVEHLSWGIKLRTGKLPIEKCKEIKERLGNWGEI
ncbi:hypothetical protein [Clostridium hydrogeniformans]|uniref:hypothetical protein n=1 Tax=Clostridium hydrogeniformans TaxID=349933 RepID=UPI00068D18EF|nr:hypothetical protein [Clostridium hydrogeniformans]